MQDAYSYIMKRRVGKQSTPYESAFEDFYLHMKRVGKEKDEGIGGVGLSGSKFREIAKPITHFIPELRKVPKGTI